MDISTLILQDLNSFKTAPFLFVGSGFTRRYLGSENWKDLLKKYCVNGMKPFDYYYSKANGDLPSVATEMSNDFFEIWWTSPIYESSRVQCMQNGQMTSKSSPLKYEISKYMLSFNFDNINDNYKTEFESLKEIVIDGVITTNWDLLLEMTFPEFDVFIGQKGLINSNAQEIAEIYKIHGSATDYNSLVLSNDDYIEFNDKNPYLAAKLIAIFIENPVFFIGYSLSDENIQNILKSITRCLNQEGINKLKKNLFFVEPIFDDAVDELESTLISIDDYNIPIKLIKLKDYSILYKAMGTYSRKISVKLLKLIKSQIYDLVKTSDPNGKLSVLGLDRINDFTEIEFVLGLGISDLFSKYGYIGLDYNDLVEDIILDNKNLNSKIMVEVALPMIFRYCYLAPFNKYLFEGGYRKHDGELVEDVHPKILSKRIKMNKEFNRIAKWNAENIGDRSYEYDLNSDLILRQYYLHGRNSIDLERLKEVLIPYVLKLRDEDTSSLSKVRKMVRIYDWLKYY